MSIHLALFHWLKPVEFFRAALRHSWLSGRFGWTEFLWVMTPCRLVGCCRLFEESSRRSHSRRSFTKKLQEEASRRIFTKKLHEESSRRTHSRRSFTKKPFSKKLHEQSSRRSHSRGSFTKNLHEEAIHEEASRRIFTKKLHEEAIHVLTKLSNLNQYYIPPNTNTPYDKSFCFVFSTESPKVAPQNSRRLH